MGFSQSVRSFFSNHSETRDNHFDESLKSHYYKVNTKKAIEAVKELVNKNPGYELTSISEERGEMSISITKGKKAFVVVTVISVRPFETSIDFSVTTESKLLPIDFGYSRKLIISFYEQLDKMLTYIGTNDRS